MKKSICFIILFSLFVFCGCNSFFSNSYTLDVVAEKKVQASRKGEILKDQKVVLVATVMHLNDVSVVAYHGREYFFVEIYDEGQLNGYIDYKLNGSSPLWIREIQSDEFDEILKPNNKWSKCYLVAFKSVGKLELREMFLKMEVIGVGTMNFDFGFKSLPMQF